MNWKYTELNYNLHLRYNFYQMTAMPVDIKF